MTCKAHELSNTRKEIKRALWKANNGHRYVLYQKKRHETYRMMRKSILENLGGACACCGEQELRFLCVDHIDPKTEKEDRENGGLGGCLVKRLFYEGAPRDRYRILCWNCNEATRLGKSCPHNDFEVKQFFNVCRQIADRLNETN